MLVIILPLISKTILSLFIVIIIFYLVEGKGYKMDWLQLLDSRLYPGLVEVKKICFITFIKMVELILNIDYFKVCMESMLFFTLNV